MTATDSAVPLTVMTVNIHKGFNVFNRKFILRDLREAVRSVGADVVFLQEVLGAHSHSHRHFADFPNQPHYEFMADSIWPQYAYGRNVVYPKGHHGNAVMSKFPIVHDQNHDVSITGREKRGLLHCVLRMPGHPARDVHAICVHLGLQEAHRQQQLELLCLMVRGEVPADAPLIVAGDFNDWRCRANGILEREGLHEVFVQARGRAAKTFPARFPLLALDRIYVRNVVVHAPMVLPRRPWSHLSDHAPLGAEIHI
jgi:endonuclease/exonuclease/phosphatase family metal-dependent hydrolase